MYFCLGLSGFPRWWVSLADRAGGAAPVISPPTLTPRRFCPGISPLGLSSRESQAVIHAWQGQGWPAADKARELVLA